MSNVRSVTSGRGGTTRGWSRRLVSAAIAITAALGGVVLTDVGGGTEAVIAVAPYDVSQSAIATTSKSIYDANVSPDGSWRVLMLYGDSPVTSELYRSYNRGAWSSVPMPAGVTVTSQVAINDNGEVMIAHATSGIWQSPTNFYRYISGSWTSVVQFGGGCSGWPCAMAQGPAQLDISASGLLLSYDTAGRVFYSTDGGTSFAYGGAFATRATGSQFSVSSTFSSSTWTAAINTGTNTGALQVWSLSTHLPLSEDTATALSDPHNYVRTVTREPGTNKVWAMSTTDGLSAYSTTTGSTWVPEAAYRLPIVAAGSGGYTRAYVGPSNTTYLIGGVVAGGVRSYYTASVASDGTATPAAWGPIRREDVTPAGSSDQIIVLQGATDPTGAHAERFTYNGGVLYDVTIGGANLPTPIGGATIDRVDQSTPMATVSGDPNGWIETTRSPDGQWVLMFENGAGATSWYRSHNGGNLEPLNAFPRLTTAEMTIDNDGTVTTLVVGDGSFNVPMLQYQAYAGRPDWFGPRLMTTCLSSELCDVTFPTGNAITSLVHYGAQTLVATVSNGGVYVSTNYGVTWTLRANIGLLFTNTQTVWAGGAYIYYAGGNSPYNSFRRFNIVTGLSEPPTTPPPDGGILVTNMAEPGDPNELWLVYPATGGFVAYKSIDRGSNWTLAIGTQNGSNVTPEALPAGSPTAIKAASMDTAKRIHLYGATTCLGNLSLTDVVRATTNAGPGVLTQLAVLPSTGTAIAGSMNQDYLAASGPNVWAKYSLDGDPTVQYVAHLLRPGIGVQTTFGFDSYGPVAGNVNTASGNFTQTATDATVAALGPALAMTRTYNSLDGRTGLFGRGWSSALDLRVISNCPVNAATVVRPDGRWEAHAFNGTTYTAPQGFRSTLATFGTGWKLTDGDGTVTTFNSAGKPTSILDASGRTQSITYDASSRPNLITDVATGRTLTIGYTGASTTASTVSTQPVTIGGSTAPRTWTYTYSGSRLATVTAPGALTTTYSYSASGLLNGATDDLGRPYFGVTYRNDGKAGTVTDGTTGASTYAYNSSTQTTVTDARNHGVTFNYDSSYRTTGVIDAAGTTWTYGYGTGDGLRNSITGPTGQITSQTINAAGLPDTVTDGGGHATSYTYDAWGNTLTVTDPRGAGYTTVNTWDGPRHLKLTTTSPPTPDQPAGTQRVWTYTTGSEPAYGSAGTMPAYLLRTESDGRGNVTTYSYDSIGNLTRIVAPSGLDSRFTYDQLGRNLTQTDYSDTYPSGVVVRTVMYDPTGGEATVTGPAFTDALTPAVTRQQRATNTFDTRGRIATQSLSDVGGSGSPTPTRTTQFTYTNNDLLLTVTDARGKVTTNTYDAAGNLATTTDRVGNVTEYSYTNANQLASIVAKNYLDPANPAPPRDVTIEARTYNSLGQLASKTDGNGTLTTYTYDGTGLPDTITIHDVTPGHNIVTTYTYDTAGNTLTEDIAGQRLTTYTWDAANRPTTKTVEMGSLADRTTSFNYDADGHVVTERITDGTATTEHRYAYDAAGRRYQSVVENGATDLTTTSAYDQRNLVIATTSPRGNTTNYIYDTAGHLTSTQLPQVRITDQTNDNVLARPTSTITYNAYGDPLARRDPNGNTTTNTLDVLGRVTRVDYPAYTQPSTGLTLSPYDTTGYDDNGNPTSYTSRNGGTWTTSYDTLGRAAVVTDPAITPNPAGVTKYTRDTLGNVTSVTNQTGAVSTYTYDGLGRQLTSTRVVRTTGSPRYETTTSAYDDLGNLTSVTNPLGKQTTMAYDNAGELLTTTAPGAAVTITAYDHAGRTKSVTDPVGRTTEITYDQAGRPTAVIHKSPAGAVLTTETRGYDADSNLTTVVSPLGNTAGNTAANYTTTFTYDAAGRQTNVSRPATASTTIATEIRYDSAGNQTKVIDPRSNTTIYTYNSMNLPESVIEPSTTTHPNLIDRTWTASYDNAGRMITYKGPNALTVTRAFDTNNNPTSETSTATGQTTVNKTFTYDAASNITSFTGAAGSTVTATWDDARRLTALTGQNYNASSFNYDLAGHPTARTDAAGTANFTWTDRGQPATMTDPLTGATRTWTYFADDHVDTATTTAGANVTTNAFTWDGLGRAATDVVKVGTTVLSSVTNGYDNDSNLTSKVTVLTGNSGAGTNTYGYDFAGRMTSWTKGTTTTYTYDLAGNRTSAGGVTSVYDQRNRLTSTGSNTTYTYNALGQRTSTVVSGKAGGTTAYTYDAAGRTTSVAGTSYTYDPFDRVVQAGTSTFAYAGLSTDPVKATGGTLYSYDPTGTPMSTKTGSTATLVDADHHGDITALYSTAGSLSATATYDPFGTTTVTTGTLGPLGYQGDLTQGANVWMAARWYQPATASFTTRDTYNGGASNPASLNRYTYGESSPLVHSDPTGRFSAPAGTTDGSSWTPQPARTPSCTGGASGDVNWCDNILTGDEVAADPEGAGASYYAILANNAANLDDLATQIGKSVLSMGISFIPYVGQAYMLYSGIVGHDPITGSEISGWHRALAIGLPLAVGAASIGGFIKGAKAAEESLTATKTALEAETTGLRNTLTKTVPSAELKTGESLSHLNPIDNAALTEAGTTELGTITHGIDATTDAIPSTSYTAANNTAIENTVGVVDDATAGVSEYDTVPYRPSNTPLENHHGVLDVWAKNNIEGYVSRAADNPTMALSEASHQATNAVYRDWLTEMTGRPVGGKIDWTMIGPREIQSLATRMFEAAGAPQEAVGAYFGEFNKYIYGLEP